MIRVLSLGAGVQSSALFLMSCIGVLPKLDAAINADPRWEGKGTYEYLEYLEAVGRNFGIPTYRVSGGDIRSHMINARTRKLEYQQLEGGRPSMMPLFTKNSNGTTGQLKRQCTTEYKIEPIRRGVSRLLSEKGFKKTPGIVEQWIGISRDEMRRMRQSDVRYIVNRYPLVTDIRMTRAECILWLEANDFQVPKKSACLGCPFRSDAEWRKVRENPEEWLDVVEFDKAIRATGGRRGETFLHRSCKPLDEVDLSSAEDLGQMNWLNECLGMCGV